MRLSALAFVWAMTAGGQGFAPRTHVMYVAEPATVAAGKPGMVAVRFKVEDGFHLNSHRPASELLLPTVLEVKGPVEAKVGAAVYPKGEAYRLPLSPESDPEAKLDVYTGAFTIAVPVTAVAGEHTLEGTLHYQACDKAACYPPKVLLVQIPVTAK